MDAARDSATDGATSAPPRPAAAPSPAPLDAVGLLRAPGAAPAAHAGLLGTATPAARAALLQRVGAGYGNRHAARAVAATRTLARDVESDQVAEEAKTETAIKDYAVKAKAASGWERWVKGQKLIWDFVHAFIPESAGKLSGSRYSAAAKGFSVSDVKEGLVSSGSTDKQGYGMVVAGDDMVERAADGKVAELAQELRGAVAQIHAIDLNASRPAIIWIGRERVRVSSMAEKSDAERIVKDVATKFGVTFDSIAARRATRKRYAGVADAVLKGVDVMPWEYKEMQALERALTHFAPILGDARKTSTRKDAAQEVTHVGKLTASINRTAGALDASYAEYYGTDTTFAMHKAGTDLKKDFGTDNAKQLEGTAVHEIAHGVFAPQLDAFMKATKYWASKTAKTGKGEAPPTPYGDENASEDLSESVMYYFVDPDRLKNGDGTATAGKVGNPCPKRFEFIKKVVAGWTPKPATVKTK